MNANEQGWCSHSPDISIRDAAMLHAQSILEDDWEATVQQGHNVPLDEAAELAAIEATADADHERASRNRPTEQPPQPDPTPPHSKRPAFRTAQITGN